MATIKEVADLAGVSVGTVSHVITGSVRVSESLRLKVQAAIDKLDYHPNHVARSLKTSKTRTLGIIVPDMTISFFPQVIRGAEAAARAQGYCIIAANSDDDTERQIELLSLLRSQRVEGVLLVVASDATPVGQIQKMVQAGIPIVYLDRIPGNMKVDSVSVQDASAAELGVSHLISRGYRHIAVATGPLTLKNEQRRLQGYKRALRHAGIHMEEELIWTCNLRPENVAAICRHHLQGEGRRPDAIFATNGPTGLGILRGLRDCGLKTPEDIGFATFDELAVPDLFTPSVTTVVQPAFDIGFKAAEILLQRIRQDPSVEQLIHAQLPATLNIRDSSRQRSLDARQSLTA